MIQPAPRRRAVGPLLENPRYEVLPVLPVLDETADLPPGTVVTVTSSPRHGLTPTVELAERLAAQGLCAVPHLAARQVRDKGELAGVLDRLEAAGIDEVFVVGGDAPHPAGEFADGLTLLRAMADLGRLPARVGVPSYPEGHWAIDDRTLWTALHDKEPYATYTVTQLCFDADAVARFVAEARRHAIDLPIVVGVPGAVGVARLLRIGLRVGVGESMRFVRGHSSVAGRLLRPGGYRPEGLLRRLGTHMRDSRSGVDLAGLHLYTFNHVTATARWVHETYRRAA